MADITKLSRLTPGEISPDQAVIDYIYYDPNFPIENMRSNNGFFNNISGKFQVGSKIHIVGRRNTTPLTNPLNTVQCVTYQVAGIDDIPNAPTNSPQRRITLLPSNHALMQSTAIPDTEALSITAKCYKFKGIIRARTTVDSSLGHEDIYFHPNSMPVNLKGSDCVIASLINFQDISIDSWFISYAFSNNVVPPDQNYIQIQWTPIKATTPPAALGPPADKLYNLYVEIFEPGPVYFRD